MIGPRLGKWVIDRELGRGGMGSVYLAHEEANSQQQAALKVLAPELAQEVGFLQRFQREIDVLGQLTHPNIVRFYEAGIENAIYYYAMEYVEGQNFEELLAERGRFAWKDVLDAALQICPALKHAHDRGIIHRDIKPPNLLLTAGGIVKLTDFGIAKVFATQQLTKTGGVVGTAEYLSPEQAAGKPATKRSDLYSLGVVLYFLLTGRPPFEGRSTADILHKHLYGQFDRPMKIVPGIPHDLDGVVCLLLEKDPAKRPADGMVLHRQLDSVRRKLERKAQQTDIYGIDDQTVAENRASEQANAAPGPATLMSQLMREELLRQKQGSVLNRWINRPMVLVPLFLLCVSILVYVFWFRLDSPEHLYAEGSALMKSENPADWELAWNKYLEPLSRHYPDFEKASVEQFRQKYQDNHDLQRAFKGLTDNSLVSPGERFYRRGLHRCAEGDLQAARQDWQNVIDAFSGVESEERWVALARQALQALERKEQEPKKLAGSVRQALQRAHELDPQERRKIREALEFFYGKERIERYGKERID
jgi:serine/threonine-protein kinase